MAVNIKCERCGSDAFRRYVEVQNDEYSLALWETLIECWTCGTYRPATAENAEQAQEPLNHRA
jgi:uncharacterized Zn finger protein